MPFLKKKKRGREETVKPASREIVVATYPEETRVAVLEKGQLVEIDVSRKSKRSMVGDIYLGQVENVLPGMEASFIKIGHARNALLYVGDIYIDEKHQGRDSNIKSLVKPGQKLMVQVTRDPMGSQGRAPDFLHQHRRQVPGADAPGRHGGGIPEAPPGGASPAAEGDRVRSSRPTVGVIVRTAARDRDEKDLRRDLEFLLRKWKEIKSAAQRQSAPSLLYSEPELEIRVTRDLLSDDWERVITDSPTSHKRLKEYLKAVAPWLAEKVVLYQGKEPLFSSLDINRQIKEALRHEVPLPSGGSIVIDPTEALTAIDVNTGRFRRALQPGGHGAAHQHRGGAGDRAPAALCETSAASSSSTSST